MTVLSLPEAFGSEAELDEFLAQPYPETIDLMRRLDGDIIILGVAGKMGPTLARLAVNASRAAGVERRVIGVSRFSEPGSRIALETSGVETIACDLAERSDVDRLPRVENVLYLAGRKFGSVGSESLTWIMNVVVPANVAQAFAGSRIVAFSTGCVYPQVAANDGGSMELDVPAPVGEYGNSCLGRERVFQYYAEKLNSPTILYRLNYAVEPRYGVLVDVATRVFAGQPVDLTVDSVNMIWQGDANNRALLCLDHTSVPADAINITGAGTIRVRDVAEQFGKLFGRDVTFTGSPGGMCYLSNAARSMEWFGPTRVPIDTVLKWTAAWFRDGGRNLGKPTHFTVTDGQYLD